MTWSSWQKCDLGLQAVSVKWLQWRHLVSLWSLYLGLMALGVDLLCCSETVWWIVLNVNNGLGFQIVRGVWNAPLLPRPVSDIRQCLPPPPSRKNKLSNKMYLVWRVPRSTWVVRLLRQTFCSWRHKFFVLTLTLMFLLLPWGGGGKNKKTAAQSAISAYSNLSMSPLTVVAIH